MSSVEGFGWFPKIRVDKFNPDTVQDAQRYLDTNSLRSHLRRGMEPSFDELALLRQHHGLVPDSVVHDEGNGLVDGGRNRIANLIIGTGSTPAFSNTNAIVGVGADNTAFAGAQTALIDNGTADAWYVGVSSGPTQSAVGKITCAAAFGTSVANFAWHEWCWAIGTGGITPGTTLASVASSPVMLNRKVASLGTKASGATWTLTTEVTINAT